MFGLESFRDPGQSILGQASERKFRREKKEKEEEKEKREKTKNQC